MLFFAMEHLTTDSLLTGVWMIQQMVALEHISKCWQNKARFRRFRQCYRFMLMLHANCSEPGFRIYAKTQLDSVRIFVSIQPNGILVFACMGMMLGRMILHTQRRLGLPTSNDRPPPTPICCLQVPP